MSQNKQEGAVRRECGPDAGHIGLLLAGMLVGAGLMYIFDPRSGRSRRAQISDQVKSQVGNLTEVAQSKARDLQNRAQGVLAEAGSRMKDSLSSFRAGDEGGGQTTGSMPAPSGEPPSQTAA